MRSWRADVLRASDHVFGSFLSPPLPLSLRGKICKTNKNTKSLQRCCLRNGLVTPEVAFASVWYWKYTFPNIYFAVWDAQRMSLRSSKKRDLFRLHSLGARLSFFSSCAAKTGQTILDIFVDFLWPLIKLSNKWSHDVMNLREARNNNKKNLCFLSNNQKFTPQPSL